MAFKTGLVTEIPDEETPENPPTKDEVMESLFDEMSDKKKPEKAAKKAAKPKADKTNKKEPKIEETKSGRDVFESVKDTLRKDRRNGTERPEPSPPKRRVPIPEDTRRESPPVSKPVIDGTKPTDYSYGYSRPMRSADDILREHIPDYGDHVRIPVPVYIPEYETDEMGIDNMATRYKPPIDTRYLGGGYGGYEPPLIGSGVSDYIPPVITRPPDISGGIGGMVRRFIARILAGAMVLVAIALMWGVYHFFGEAKVCYRCGYMTHKASAVTVKLSGNGGEWFVGVTDGEYFNKRTYYFCDDCMTVVMDRFHKDRTQ